MEESCAAVEGFCVCAKGFCGAKDRAERALEVRFSGFFLLAEEFAAERNLSALFFGFNLFDV